LFLPARTKAGCAQVSICRAVELRRQAAFRWAHEQSACAPNLFSLPTILGAPSGRPSSRAGFFFDSQDFPQDQLVRVRDRHRIDTGGKSRGPWAHDPSGFGWHVFDQPRGSFLRRESRCAMAGSRQACTMATGNLSCASNSAALRAARSQATSTPRRAWPTGETPRSRRTMRPRRATRSRCARALPPGARPLKPWKGPDVGRGVHASSKRARGTQADLHLTGARVKLVA